jgi:hypothetical protein
MEHLAGQAWLARPSGRMARVFRISLRQCGLRSWREDFLGPRDRNLRCRDDFLCQRDEKHGSRDGFLARETATCAGETISQDGVRENCGSRG